MKKILRSGHTTISTWIMILPVVVTTREIKEWTFSSNGDGRRMMGPLTLKLLLLLGITTTEIPILTF
jgi:hypothetical protein